MSSGTIKDKNTYHRFLQDCGITATCYDGKNIIFTTSNNEKLHRLDDGDHFHSQEKHVMNTVFEYLMMSERVDEVRLFCITNYIHLYEYA